MSFKLDFRASLEGDTEIKRKFEDLEKTLQDVKKAAEDSSKPLEETAKAMDDLGKSAGDVDKDLKDTSGALDDVSKSAGDIKKDLDDTAKSFDDISKSAVDVSKDLKDADSGFSDIAQNADGAVSSMDAVKSSFEGISQSAVEADQNIAAATTGLEGVGTATESAAAGADSLASSLDNITASAKEAETNISAAANGIDGIGTSIGQAETALDGLGSAFDGAGTATTTFNDVLTSTGTQAQAASGGLTPLNTVLGQVGGAAGQAQTGFQGFNSNLAVMTGFIGTASSGALQFATSLSNLHGAQIKVEATQGKLSAAIEAENKARAKLNELYASGTASTEQIAQAELDLQQAHEKTGIAAERAGKAQDDLNIKYAKFATDTLPQIIQTVTSTIAVLGTMKTAISGISFAELAASITTVAIPAFAALYTAIGVLESVPALTKSISAAIQGDMDGMMTNLDDFLGVLERFASVLPGLGGAPLKLAREALDQYAKSQGVATKEVDASIPSLLNAETHQKNLGEAIDILTGKNTNLGTSQQTSTQATEQQAAAIAATKAEIEGARAGIDGYVAGIQQQAEASGTLESALRQTNKAMQENISQTMDLVGSTENHDNAILKLSQSYADHQVAIDQLAHTLGTTEGQMASYMNAVASGNEKFLQWVQSTRDAATEAETFKTNLQGMADAFGGLPGFMEGTVAEYQAFIEANEQGGEAVDKFADMALESWRNLVSEAEPLFNDLKEAWSKVRSGIWEEGEIEGELIDPVLEAFKKLPPAVAQTLDEVELKAISFQAEFAAVAEEAGTAWATNLQANMGQGFDQALQEANQAAADVLAPFIQEHPETAQMFQPLFDAMNQTGPGAAQAVQEVLEEMSGMPGPVGETAAEMLKGYQEKFADQLPGVTKTGVEGAVSAMQTAMTDALAKINTTLEEGFADVVIAINADTSEADKKVDTLHGKISSLGTGSAVAAGAAAVGAAVGAGAGGLPKIDVDTSAATTAIDDLQTKIDGMGGKNVLITVDTGPAGIAIQGLQTQLDQMAGKNVAITVDTGAAGIAITELQGQIDGVVGKNVTITVDTGAAGIAITGLQGQIDGVVGKNVTITVDTGAAGLAITGLQGNIDGVHGKNVAITVDTGAAGLAITEIQGQIDGVHGTNVYITVDTSGAQEAIRQLQNQINSLQSSMGGMGGGYTPGYQSPYGSYQGAYGSPYGYASGFGPAIINRPTRMLVGEAGPEMVSVIPMKGTNQKNPPRSITAAAGMGWYGPASGGLGYGAVPRTYNLQQLSQILARDQGQMQQGAQQGTQEGMQQSQPGMEQAVQQGAQQGVQDGMQQGGGGGGYPMAPSNTELWGAGRFTWGGGASGTQLGAPGGGGAQYPTASRPMGAAEAIGFGSRPIKYTWTGGAMGTSLTPTGPHVGEGLPGPDPHAFNRQATNVGTGAGSASGKSFAKAFDAGVQGQSQLINGVPATILSGNGGPARQAGNEAGTAAGQGFAQGFNDQMGSINTSAITQGQAGYPKAYTGEVPASYGKPLGQLINGIAATILPGQGPRGPPMQAAFGMHRKLSRDTLIQAHRNERVDITPGANAADTTAKANEYANAAIDRITNLLEKLLSQGNTFKVDFNVDGRKLSSVAAKHMGTTGYGDK